MKNLWKRLLGMYLGRREEKIAGGNQHGMPHDRIRIYHGTDGKCVAIAASDEAEDHLDYWPELKK